MKQTINIFWFRRDLRLEDNHGFFEALKSDKPVLPIFIFDNTILSKLPKDDARVTFIHESLQEMREVLEIKYNSVIAIYHGTPENIYKALIENYTIDTVYTNSDYEPYAISRDKKIKTLLESEGITFKAFKDQVVLSVMRL